MRCKNYMPKIENPILITGCHRSGTTFVGKVLSFSHQISYLNEPFNLESGISGIQHAFPYIGLGDSDSEKTYIKLIDDFFSFRAKFGYTKYESDGVVKTLLKKTFGTKASIQYKWAWFLNILPWSKRRLLIKDPTAAFLSGYLATKYDCRVLILVRHPGAFLASIKRLGWGWDFKHFLEQRSLMNNYLKELEPLLDKPQSIPYQAALLWLSIYKVLHSFYKDDGNWKIVRHEDICLNPLEQFQLIYKWLEMDFTNETMAKTNKLTNLKNKIEACSDSVHDLRRNSRGLVNYWKKSLSYDEIEILQKITEPISTMYYDNNSWAL